MRLFVSAGEPSGDLHGANLVRALRRIDPGIVCGGFGGDRMAEAGVDLVYPLCDDAVVGFFQVIASVPHFRGILNRADRYLREHRPDAVVMIDFPGFHWWLARRAQALHIPVIYFVPPQLWAWGGWRAGKMRQLVNEVLAALPFEEEWYRNKNIPTRYIGHPYFDELGEQRLDPAFMAEQRRRPGPIVALLPGSRRQELENNPESLLRTASLVHARRPDARFLVACLKPEHKERVDGLLVGSGLPVEAHAGRTAEIIELCHSAVAVSGSVGLELLYRGKPSVVVYRSHWSGIFAARWLIRCKYISLVNLLAGKQLYPEFLTHKCEAEGMAAHVLRWLNDEAGYRSLCGELRELRDRVAAPGACDRAARRILELVGTKRRSLAA